LPVGLGSAVLALLLIAGVIRVQQRRPCALDNAPNQPPSDSAQAIRETIMRGLLTAAILSAAVALLGGCNTMQGLGQDFQKLGEAIEGEAEDN
jgi:predicted small secreted protein